MGGFGIRAAFDIGRKTLRSQLAGLNVTGNNIANVNTKGYSRQEIVLNPDIPITSTEGVFGTGVTLAGVRRIRDQLIDRQVRTSIPFFIPASAAQSSAVRITAWSSAQAR